ncbi:Calmodulin-like protein 9 [Apostasia shenzhenica]|uniref:Calmodulin-like protein 9 n=1 Tax=Apostasia shenzhenica TaxID=1088818 RepID=A0A2H9ZZZ6_9ASPA|nr:Calmodulin-like protein 9 [Apostasia shenzhenica]
MGNASSMLTQYDIEEVQEHCNYLCESSAVSQQEIVALYERFCQLDRSANGFISADEFLSIPEFSLNPLSQRLLKMVDGLNFTDFVAFLSAFSPKASIQHKIESIFRVHDIDGKGRVTLKDLLEVLRDLTGSFMSEEQRKVLCTPCSFNFFCHF